MVLLCLSNPFDSPHLLIQIICIPLSCMEKMLLFMVSSQTLIFQATEQEYEKEKLNERIAKLSGGVAVIQVKPNVKP